MKRERRGRLVDQGLDEILEEKEIEIDINKMSMPGMKISEQDIWRR